MANGHLGGIVRHLKSLLGAQDARAATDGELLKRFSQQHDEAAYAALVERYAPLVSGVCRRVLQNDHDAEDVFQATFLVLLRKAGSLDGRGTVANWLYTVAYHLALKARARTGQRRARERQVADMPEVETPTEPLWHELRPLLDEELDRLPAKYRSPMVLCYLTGKTNEQAAQELGWTKDTVRGRLARGRELLRNRLARRGVTLTAGILATVLSEQAGQAAVPATWINATLQAGALFAAGNTAASGISASVLALVHAALKEVFFAKLKVAAALCLLVGIAGTGVGVTAFVRSNTPAPVARGVVRSGFPPASPVVRPAPAPSNFVPDPVEENSEEEMREDSASVEAVSDFPLHPPDPPLDLSALKVRIKRRDWACESELQKQLLAVPELRLDTTKDRATSEAILRNSEGPKLNYTLDLLAARTDLAGLPLRRGEDCRLPGQPAKDLASLSRELRMVLGELMAPRGKPKDGIEPHLLSIALWKNLADRTRTVTDEDRGHSRPPIFRSPGALPALMQMLTAEDSGIRLVLVQQLTGFAHPAASEALARLALFDLAPEVRAAAVEALARRPRIEYRAFLLDGFRYPWAPVADHAAETLVALEDRDAVPALKELARESDPTIASTQAPAVREVVRINHLRNCLMCHAASHSKDDLVRGLIPDPDRPLPPLIGYYGQDQNGIFVRADITYLRQDFSVKQPVVKDKSDPWPDRQRYDYLVRTRPLTPEEYGSRSRRPAPATSPQREAVLYALQELTAK